MNVLILGSGGREHAFAWKIAQSKQLENLYIAPGNAGTANCGTNVNISATDFEAVKKLVWEKDINLVLVGPEDPLVKGIHDFFLADEILRDIPVIGPKKDGAILEGSKDFSKAFMFRHGVPTAAYQTFTSANIEDAPAFLEKMKAPYVLKADGLAAGKGVLILNDLDEAKRELNAMINDAKFGDASSRVVIEEYLHGIELSVFVLTDGKSYKILPAAKDYKRIGVGDTGLNTGGMGAISPVPFADATFLKKVEEQIVIPTINGLVKENIDYRGFIFIGLMNCNGEPKVIEYNCRMGDPETEVVIPRIKSDILDLFLAVAKQELHNCNFEIDERIAATVMLVAGGYPEEYEKGNIITGLENVEGSIAFHAGTKQYENDILTNGGRLITVTSFGSSISDATEKSFANIEKINYKGKYFRNDIGRDLIRF